MADLYHRLVEYNEILCRLVDDVEQLHLFLGERDEIIDTKKEQEANR